MRVVLERIKGNWREIADAARTTIGLEAGTLDPKSEWKRRMLLCEHSPIRKLIICWKWFDLMSWVSVHLVRHKYGIEHWVKSQRPDRTGQARGSQNDLVDHECEANAQAIINTSRKRLCLKASTETRDAWLRFINSFKDVEPELFKVCVPDCVYRGWCYEYKSCGYYKTQTYQQQLYEYRSGINGA